VIEGDFGELVIPTFLDCLDMNPQAKLLVVTRLGVAVLFGLQELRSQSHFSKLREFKNGQIGRCSENLCEARNRVYLTFGFSISVLVKKIN
jgi:hypothetical protein